MITDKIKTILTDSGCSLVLYDQEQLANLYVDQSNQVDIVGVIIMPSDVVLEVRANAIHEHYNPLRIEILKQAAVEAKGETNDLILEELLRVVKEVIFRLIHAAQYKTITPITATRVLESRYDANVIGWSVPLNLYYLLNETRDPCL